MTEPTPTFDDRRQLFARLALSGLPLGHAIQIMDEEEGYRDRPYFSMHIERIIDLKTWAEALDNSYESDEGEYRQQTTGDQVHQISVRGTWGNGWRVTITAAEKISRSGSGGSLEPDQLIGLHEILDPLPEPGA